MLSTSASYSLIKWHCLYIQDRIMLELNYMLSYGAAEPSLCLLQRFSLLELILPFQVSGFSRI
jgi:tRNA nucleotidyltransferase/poly(A) polymerase